MRVFSSKSSVFGDGAVTSGDAVCFEFVRVPSSEGIGRQQKVSEGLKNFMRVFSFQFSVLRQEEDGRLLFQETGWKVEVRSSWRRLTAVARKVFEEKRKIMRFTWEGNFGLVSTLPRILLGWLSS